MTPPHPAQPFNTNIFPNVIQCPPEFFKLKRHKCRFCDYRTDLLWVKKRHEKYVHKATDVDTVKTKDSPSIAPVSDNTKCQFCAYIGRTPDDVKEHIADIHNINRSNVIIEKETKNNGKGSKNPNFSKTEKTLMTSVKRKNDEENLNNSSKRLKLTNDGDDDDDDDDDVDDPLPTSSSDIPSVTSSIKRKNDDDNDNDTFAKRVKVNGTSSTSESENVVTPVIKQGNIILSSGNSGIVENEQILEGPFNLQFVENFKLSIFGPSRSGKTTFVRDILINLEDITRNKIEKVYYIFSKWQNTLKELKKDGLVDTFIEGHSDIESELNELQKPNEKSLVIFDDQARDKKITKFASKLFSIQARHSNMSVIWISQSVFDGDAVKNIRMNSDYITLFKCPQDCLHVSNLSIRMTASTIIRDIYQYVTNNDPYSYIFIDVTQESVAKIKYRSHLFQKKGLITTYVPNRWN